MFKFPIEETLFINRNDSKCGNCGEGADPNEKWHETVLGYGVKSNEVGCAIEWKYVGTEYADQKNFMKYAKKMKPDLPWNEFTLEDNDLLNN